MFFLSNLNRILVKEEGMILSQIVKHWSREIKICCGRRCCFISILFKLFESEVC